MHFPWKSFDIFLPEFLFSPLYIAGSDSGLLRGSEVQRFRGSERGGSLASTLHRKEEGKGRADVTNERRRQGMKEESDWCSRMALDIRECA